MTRTSGSSRAKGQADLAVIVVSHNSAGCLSRCLSSVYAKSGDLELDVVVVDSGSTDDTVDLVRRHFPNVRVLATENRGFAAANNRGLAIVDAEWILFLNPDTEILSGTLAVPRIRGRDAADRRSGRRQAGRRGWGLGADDATIPQRRSIPICKPRRGTTPISRLVVGRTGARDRSLRPSGPVRLDRWIVHARTRSRAPRRRWYGRAVLFCTRRRRTSVVASKTEGRR